MFSNLILTIIKNIFFCIFWEWAKKKLFLYDVSMYSLKRRVIHLFTQIETSNFCSSNFFYFEYLFFKFESGAIKKFLKKNNVTIFSPKSRCQTLIFFKFFVPHKLVFKSFAYQLKELCFVHPLAVTRKKLSPMSGSCIKKQ